MMKVMTCAAVMTAAQVSLAQAIELTLPVDCTLGDTCFIQNYVDADPSSGHADFTCNRLSYDGHTGTDIAFPAARDMARGIPILATADGTVVAIRDGVPEQLPGEEMSFPKGEDCGNGILLYHDDGWETQYCHLRTGSIWVQGGDYIAAGQQIGEMGMSGRTEFPHLHMTVRKDGQVVDPFDPSPDSTCGAAKEDQLWQPALPYQPGGVLQAGFASEVPEFDTIKIGDAHRETVDADQGALVFWVHLFGTRKGDEIALTINGPKGVFFDTSVVIDRTQAQAFRAGGRHLNSENTVPGPYQGVARHMRDGREIGRIAAETTLE